MSSIDALLKRARRLHGAPDDVLEAEFDALCEVEKEQLLAELDAQIARDKAEGIVEHDSSMSPEAFEAFCTEFDIFLEDTAEEAKQAWMVQQRKRVRR